MSIIETDADGNETELFVSLEGGRLLAMVRAKDKATFDAQALAVGLTMYTNAAINEVLDPDTGDVLVEARPASGPIIPTKFVTITEIGPLVLTPAVLDEDNAVVTEAVMDNRHHANFWLHPRLVELGRWRQWAYAWTLHGQPSQASNANERAKALEDIELIDPASVRNPRNVML